MRFSLEQNDLSLAALRDFLMMGAEPVFDREDALVLRFNGLFYGAGACDESPDFRAALMALCVNGAAAGRMVGAGLFDDVTPVLQYVYTGPLPEEPRGDFTLCRLTPEHVPFLVEHYSHPSATEKHMSERVCEGFMLGAFRGEICMGFAGIHEEGAIGMLTVLPAYRRQGVASALLLSLVRRQLLAGHVPYTHVHPDNIISMALQEKLGFIRAEETAVWLCKHDAYYRARL